MDNPKHIQAQKDGKAPLEYLVTTVFDLDAAVHKHGADKYGKLNWRIDKITATTYVAAMMRHLKAWIEGHDLDPESGKPHLTHLRACCAVVLDAQMHGTLIDDRLRMESKGETDARGSSAVVAAAREIPGVKSVSGEFTEDEVLEAQVILGSGPRLQGYPNPRCAVCFEDPCNCRQI